MDDEQQAPAATLRDIEQTLETLGIDGDDGGGGPGQVPNGGSNPAMMRMAGPPPQSGIGAGPPQFWMDQQGNILGSAPMSNMSPMPPQMGGELGYPQDPNAPWMHPPGPNQLPPQFNMPYGWDMQAQGMPPFGFDGRGMPYGQHPHMNFPPPYMQQYPTHGHHGGRRGRAGGYGGGGGRGYNGGGRGYGGGMGHYGGGHDTSDGGNSSEWFGQGRDAQNVPWEELVGKISELVLTQHGSIALQARLEEHKQEYVSATLVELRGTLSNAMMNKYGSHLTRLLVERCSNTERAALLEEIAPQLVEISRSRFGTWTIQKLVECVEGDEQIAMLKAPLHEEVVSLTKCPNGNHVIKFCLQTMTPSDNHFIYEALTRDIMGIARHKYGCSMLQRCLDYATEEQARLVADRVALDAMPLIEDAFGNYIVQYVLELGFEESSIAIVDQMIGSFVRLSREKFGSNVVEKCVGRAASPALEAVLVEVMAEDALETLVADRFGNYVVQSMLEHCSDEAASRIGARLKPMLDDLQRTVHGKRIRQKLYRRLPDEFPRTVPMDGTQNNNYEYRGHRGGNRNDHGGQHMSGAMSAGYGGWPVPDQGYPQMQMASQPRPGFAGDQGSMQGERYYGGGGHHHNHSRGGGRGGGWGRGRGGARGGGRY